MSDDRETIACSAPASEPPPGAVAAVLEALLPGRFRTLTGYRAYRAWCLGELPDSAIDEMAGRTG